MEEDVHAGKGLSVDMGDVGGGEWGRCVGVGKDEEAGCDGFGGRGQGGGHYVEGYVPLSISARTIGGDNLDGLQISTSPALESLVTPNKRRLRSLSAWEGQFAELSRVKSYGLCSFIASLASATSPVLLVNQPDW